MDVFVKVYKIASQVEDPANAGNIAGGKTIDDVPLLDVAEFGSVKKYLEEEETEFRMDSITLKTEFLRKGYFEDYDPQSPYLLEAQVGPGWDAEDARCIFYGPIKKKSIKYNERTGVTSFEASSWERAIKQAGQMIARDRIPLKIAANYQRGSFESNESTSFLRVVGLDPDIGNKLERGAVINTKGKVGDADIDLRLVVASQPTQDGDVDGNPIYKFRAASGADDLIQLGPNSGVDLLWNYTRRADPLDFFETKYDYWWAATDVIGAPVEEVGDVSESAEGARLQLTMDGSTEQYRVKRAFKGPKLDGPEPKIEDLKMSNVDRGEYVWFVLDGKITGKGFGPVDNDPLERFPEGTSNNSELPGRLAGSWSLNKRMRISADTEATLLSSDAYGQGGGKLFPYSAVELAQGIATRTPALADLLDGEPTILGEPGGVTRLYEFPEKGIKSLGQIQRSSESRISFAPRSSLGFGGGRKDVVDSQGNKVGEGARKVKMLVRTRSYLAGQSAIDLPGALEWKGEALGDQPDAVLVKGPDPINVTIERDETYGWWPKDEIKTPSSADEGGKDVVEIEVPLVEPAVEGEDSFGVPLNVPMLSGRAKRYYDFYSQYYREKEVVVNGVLDNVPGGDYEESMLGQLVSEDESVLESGIVKSQEVDYNKEETSLTLLVAEGYTEPANAAPVALVQGPEYFVGDQSGSATIFLDATASYDPNGDPISFQWEKNGVPVSGETGRVFEGTVQDGDNIGVIVTDPDGATDRDDITATVLASGEDPGDPDAPPSIDVSYDGAESDGSTSVFDVRAWKKSAPLSVYYQISDGKGVVDSGEIAQGVGVAEGSLSVDRIENQQGRSLDVTFWAVDTFHEIQSQEKSRSVRENTTPEITQFNVDPTPRGDGSILAYVQYDDDTTSYTLSWEVKDDTGAVVDSDSHPFVSENTLEFYIAEVPDGGSGYIEVKPFGFVGSGDLQMLVSGPPSRVLLGPGDENGRITIVGQQGNSSTSLSDPASTLNINEVSTDTGVEYEVSAPQKIGPSDSPDFAGVSLGSHAVGGIQTVLRDSSNATDDRLVTEKGARDAIDAATGGGALDDLSDVGVSSPADNEVLTYSTEEGQWRNESPATLTGGDGIEPIGSLGSDQTVAVDGTVARTNADETFDQNVTIQGDLTVNGTRFEANVETVEISDNLAVINDGETGSGVTAGFAGWEVDRGSLTDYYFGFDEGRDRFVVGQGTADRDVVATREDSPSTGGIPFWNEGENRFDTSSALQWDGSDVLIGSGKATVTNEDEVIEGAWDFNAAIETSDFASRTTGWQIAEDGAADFRSIWADELRVQAFTADVAQALVGTEIITKSRATVAENFTVPATGNTATLRVEDIDGQDGMRAFTDGDTVRLRVVDRSGGGLVVADVWGTVSNYSDNGDGTQSWVFQVADDGGVSGKTIHEGATALDWGTPGDGQIYSTVLDSAGSPYTDHRTWADSDSDGVPDSYDTLVRIGVLDGISGVSGDGLWTKRGRFTEDVLIGDLSKTNGYIEANQGTLTVQGRIIVKGDSDIGWSYVSGSNKPEDGATVGATWGSNIADPNNNLPEDNATFGSTWGNVTGANKPEDGATEGATWGSNISDPNGNLPEDNATFGAAWANVTGPNRPSDNADVTANNQAASISGQGSLATQDNADWVSDIANRPNAADLLQDFEPSVDNQLAITPGGLGYYTVDGNGDFNGWISALLDDGTGFLANGLIAWDKSTGDFGNANADLTVEGEIFVQQGSVRDNFIVGDSIFMWDSHSLDNPTSTVINGTLDSPGDDEIRVSRNGTGTGGSNYSRIYQDPDGNAWGIEQKANNSRTFHVGEDSNGNLDNVIAGWEFDQTTLSASASSAQNSDGGGIEIAAGVGRQAGDQGDTQSYVCVHNSDQSTFASMYYAHDDSFGLVVSEDGTKKVHFGDEMMMEGEVIVDGSVTTQLLDSDAVTTDKISITNALTIEPGGSFFAGGGQGRFAFGDFPLSSDTKGQVNHTDEGAYAQSSGTVVNDSFSFTRTDIDMGGSDSNSKPWIASVSVEYSIAATGTNEEGSAQITVKALDGGGSVLDSITKSDSVQESFAGGYFNVNMTLPDGTKQVKVEGSSSAIGNGSKPDATAQVGDDVNGSIDNPPETEISSSTDFFGPGGATWRNGGAIQVEINGRDGSAPNTSPGQIWVADTVKEGSDRRMKEDITRVNDPAEVLADINGYAFTKSGRRQYGVIAQEVRDSGAGHAVSEGEDGLLSVSYSALHAFEIEMLNDHERRLQRLEEKAQ